MIYLLKRIVILCLCGLLVGCNRSEIVTTKKQSKDDGVGSKIEEDSMEETKQEGTLMEKGNKEEELLTTEDEMLKRTIVSKSSNYRFHKVIEKLKNKESVTIAFIGGSITEGYNAMNKKPYAERVTDYFVETYGNKENITFINAGLGGTPSMLGLIRADRDVLVYKPDLVFIEFAVNDAQSMTDKIAYESLVRKILEQDNEPAVLLLFSVIQNGYTCQTQMSEIGFYYNLPMVSVKNVIQKEIELGTFTWEDWTDDEVHPTPFGHELYTKMIIYTMEQLLKEEVAPSYVIPKAKFRKDWSNMKLYDSSNLTSLSYGAFEKSSAHNAFPNSLSKSAANIANDNLVFRFHGNTLFLTYKTVATGNYGTAQVYVNQELAIELDGLTNDGWNNPTTKLIISEKESKDYTVEIRMKDGDEDKQFDILAIGIVGEIK